MYERTIAYLFFAIVHFAIKNIVYFMNSETSTRNIRSVTLTVVF